MTELRVTRCVLLVIEKETGAPAEGVDFTAYGDGGWVVANYTSGPRGLTFVNDPEVAEWLYIAETHDDRYEVGMISYTTEDGASHGNPLWPRRYVPRCTQDDWAKGSTCPEDATGGLRVKGTVRWYCDEHLARWMALYDDLETEYEATDLSLVVPPECDAH